MSTYNKVPKIYSNHGGHCEIAMYGIYAFVGKSRRRFLSQPIDPNTPGLMDVLPSPGKNTHNARRRNKLAYQKCCPSWRPHEDLRYGSGWKQGKVVPDRSVNRVLGASLAPIASVAYDCAMCLSHWLPI